MFYLMYECWSSLSRYVYVLEAARVYSHRWRGPGGSFSNWNAFDCWNVPSLTDEHQLFGLRVYRFHSQFFSPNNRDVYELRTVFFCPWRKGRNCTCFGNHINLWTRDKGAIIFGSIHVVTGYCCCSFWPLKLTLIVTLINHFHPFKSILGQSLLSRTAPSLNIINQTLWTLVNCSNLYPWCLAPSSSRITELWWWEFSETSAVLRLLRCHKGDAKLFRVWLVLHKLLVKACISLIFGYGWGVLLCPSYWAGNFTLSHVCDDWNYDFGMAFSHV